jgi:hypothetical protein
MKTALLLSLMSISFISLAQAEIKAGEEILLTTYIRGSQEKTVSRYCDVFKIEGNSARVGCNAVAEDTRPNENRLTRVDFVVNDLSQAIPEIQELDGFKKGEKVIVSDKKYTILAIFTNGEVLVGKNLGPLDSKIIVNRNMATYRLHTSDLAPAN